MYELTKLTEIVLLNLLVCIYTAMSFTPLLPHFASYSGKTHFPINICDAIYYEFHFTLLESNGVKQKVPLILSDREFGKKMHKNYSYMRQSDVLPAPWHRWFEGILRFAQVASMKGSKREYNAVVMRL
jgi:hypothetical protein